MIYDCTSYSSMWSLSRLFSITSWWQLLRAKCNVWSRYTSRGDICCLIVFFFSWNRKIVRIFSCKWFPSTLQKQQQCYNGEAAYLPFFVSLLGSWITSPECFGNWNLLATPPARFFRGFPSACLLPTYGRLRNEKALKRQWRDKWRLIRKYGRRKADASCYQRWY